MPCLQVTEQVDVEDSSTGRDMQGYAGMEVCAHQDVGRSV